MNTNTDFIRADSSNLPKVDMIMLMEFMKSSDKYNVAEIRGAKALMSSRQSYVESAVGYVEVKRIGSLCDVRAKIVPEHKISSKYYTVMVHLNEKEDVITGTSCDSCAAAAGGCKHTLVFLFWLQKRSAEPSPTSVECYWVKPNLKRARDEVILIKDLINSKVPERGSKDASILKKFRSEAQKHACGNSLIMTYDQNQNKQKEKLTNYCIFDMTIKFVEEETDHSFENYNDFTFETNAIIMKSLIKNLPSTTFTKPNWTYLDNIKLADPEFHRSRPVDLLLGADVYSNLLQDGICRMNESLPIAQQTKLGWILSGHTKTIQCNVVLHNLEEIERFWEVEDISEPSDVSSEDQKCIEYYNDTTSRKQDGRYEVRVPFKPNYHENLGHSKNKALAQFYNLEQKLNKQQNIAKDYKLFINEYIALGHMTPEGNDCNKKLECYLPHHCVTRQESTTTKLRVVFNASSKTSSGLSLNDVMYRGPNLQQDLQSLVLKWRQFKFAFTADLEKMFRQIWLHEEDQDLHKIIWRENHHEQVQAYRLATVTYGTKAAPFLAMMTLKRLAKDERANYQNSSATEVLEQSFYMDDLIHGAHSPEAARQLKRDLINLLKSGGFNLRKWNSNLPELLEDMENNQAVFDFKQAESSSGKTLGLGWNPREDCFTFQSRINPNIPNITKRALLGEISKLYDPLGWLSPLTTKLKILFQDIWKANIQWDESVPENIQQQWIKITADIQSIEDYQVPRWLGIEEGDNIELHGFCDASTKCYACVVYCKITKKGSQSIVLVAGKAKLVPLSKTISLPRLELCSAALLAKLMSKIKQCLNDYSVTIYAWSDSMAALGWLHGDAERWKPFVANRVKQISPEIPPQCWRYVKSKENPADCASRGLTATQLKEHDLWWQGPTWLPTYQATVTDSEMKYTTEQEQRTKHVCTTQVSCKNDVVNTILNRTSSFNTAINILAWVLRFIHKGKGQYLSVAERRRARAVIIKQVQQEEFNEEINCLKTSKVVRNNSRLSQLSPILDENGVLRIGGRLRHANIEWETKHPAIIPKNSRLGDLIIDGAHECTYHGGARLTTAFTRRQYWIIGGIEATKKRIRHCVTCRRQNPEEQHQIMGDLPQARVNPSRPFYHTGVDYTGHVMIKANKGRGIKTTKGYIAVFVCMVTKAVHLELVSDLTSSAFLAALRRMTARRGVPGHIYSDQGRNFIGANHILQQEYEEIQKIFTTEFKSEVASMNIEWHFNAPAWPSAGGLWESSVKSLKHHLKRVIGEQKLTFEEYSTLLSQLEGCLNSRPLVPLTEDASDLDVITPSHFLASGPALNILETETDMRTRWHLTQKIFRDIWDRWRDEYLTQLSTRSKWRKPQPNIKENDIVIIKDENLPPGKWALGRVVQLHPGNDGYVRVVTLKTKNGLMQRPIVKLSILPVNKGNEEKQESSKKEDTQSAKPASSKKKSYCLSTIATRLLLFFMTIIPTIECSYRMTSLQNTSLHFDAITNMHVIRDEWRLVVYYDTLPYQEGNTTLTKYIKYLDGLCMRINTQSHCNEIMLQLRHEFTELQYYNNILRHKKHDLRTRRRRRGLINGVGYIANSLFGVLDDHFAEQYKQDIDLIKTNQRHLASLWKNQTSIVEAEFNVLKRTEIIMEKHHKIINSRMNAVEMALNQVNSALQNISLENEFISTAMMTNNLLISLQNVQQTLLDTVTNIYNGKFNFHLLTPDQLKQELNVIAGLIHRDLTLPVENYDLSKMYNLLQVRARVTEGYVIFEIKIPLIGRDMFEISRIIPVPYQVDLENENVIVPISEYAGTNVNKDAFVPLTESDVNSCTRRDTNTVLCQLKMPIYQIKNDRSFCEKIPNSRTCKTITSPCHNRWTELNKLNTYFYFCCQQGQVKLLCDDQVTSVQMTNAGLLSVDQGCTIKTTDFLVYSHRREFSNLSISSHIPAPEISVINQLYNFSIPEHFVPSNTTETIENLSDLREIQKQLENMKKVEAISDKVSYHDVHHYVAIYVLMSAVAASAAVLAWRRCRRSAAAAEAPAAPQPAARFTSNVQCSAVGERVVSVVTNQCSDSGLVLRQNKSTSPVLRSIFTIPNSND